MTTGAVAVGRCGVGAEVRVRVGRVVVVGYHFGPTAPKGAQAVVSCPYCHTTVIVPETLRQSAEPAARNTTVLETFASNDNGWQLGVEQSRFFTPLQRDVRDGRYRWDAHRGPDSGTTTAFLPAYQVADFHVQVNAKHIVGSKTGRAGASCSAAAPL